MKIQYVLSFQETLQMLADAYRTHSHRSSGKNQVTCLKGAETAYVLNYLRYRKNHIGGMPLLNGLSVYVKTEMQVLQVSYIILWNPVTYHGRLVKPFA